MKIFVSSMSADLGGIEKSLIEFLKFLVANGCDVDLLLWKQRGGLLERIPKEVVMLDSPSCGSLSSVFKSRSIKALFKYIKQRVYTAFGSACKSFPKIAGRYDVAVAYTQDGYSPCYVIDNITAGKKYLWYHHGAYEKRNDTFKRDNKYFACFDKIVTVSNANKKMLASFFPDLEPKITVINNLIDTGALIEASKEPCESEMLDDGCNIVSVGRICEEKGQMDAIEIARSLAKKRFVFRWIFVGDGPDLISCVDKVREYGLSSSCFFVGSKTNPYSYIRNADLFLHTSFVESESITVREAMILNKYILSRDIPAVSEVLAEYENCRLCSSIDEFAERIIEAYEEKKYQTPDNAVGVNFNAKSEQQLYELIFKGQDE